MASVHLQSAFDFSPRPQTHQGIHSSLAESPRIRRPISQESLKIQPGGNFSPAPNHADSGHPLSAYPSSHPQPFHQYQPSGHSLPLPPPHQGYMSGLPNTTPPIPIWSSNTPIFDSRHSHAMIRTISHGHPMTSATEHTISSRYSSPHSATLPNDAPPSAGAYSIPPPSFNFQDPEQRHINPALFNQNSYPMSRSTSGASDAPHNVGHRLLTPHYQERHGRLNSSEQELRKVSDSLGRNRPFYPGTFTPNIDLLGHGLGLGVHPQPEGDYFSRGYSTEHFALSAERGETKPDIVGLHGDTEYERERAAQIMNNKKLLEDVGLGAAGNSFVRSRNIGGISHERSRNASTPQRKRIFSEGPVRASPRIASLHRNVSYADLDGVPMSEDSEGEDEYSSGQDFGIEEEDEFRPTKRSRASKHSYGRKYTSNRSVRKVELSLWGLLEVYPEIPHLFPLFYYTLNNDLTINCDSVPLIGSIPSTCTPTEKAESLRSYFQKGRRVLAQLDNFTARCDRKYEGPEERWTELEYNTRIAVRDVRRKIVERCENYKYTRRDILDKVVGKNKWPPIDQGMIEWRPGMAQNDPAGDLAHVTLTLPTPPPSVYQQQQQQQQQQRHQPPSGRAIRPFPMYNRPRIASNVTRTVSVAMASPEDHYTPHIMSQGYAYPHHEPQPPLYGEDQVPMTGQMPAAGPSEVPGTAATLAPAQSPWDGMSEVRGTKRARSDVSDHEENGDGSRSGEELGFGEHRDTLWQE